MQKPNRVTRKRSSCLPWGCGVAVLLMVTFIAYSADSNRYDNTILYPLKKGHMLAVTREWARIAPIPESAEDFSIETAGGMFTREFDATFRAPLPVIEQWLDSSPGTRDEVPQPGTREDGMADEATAEELAHRAGSKGLGSSGVWWYDVDPGDGASYARVWVDVEKGKVRVRVYWS